MFKYYNNIKAFTHIIVIITEYENFINDKYLNKEMISL